MYVAGFTLQSLPSMFIVVIQTKTEKTLSYYAFKFQNPISLTFILQLKWFKRLVILKFARLYDPIRRNHLICHFIV